MRTFIEHTMSRRQALTAGGVAAGIFALGLTGCNQPSPSQGDDQTVDVPEESGVNRTTGLAFDATGADISDACAALWEPKVSKTYETDIVVVGTGMSGSAAMVSAAEHGAKVIALEVNDSMNGSNGSYTDCVFEIGTEAQKDAAIRYGLEITPGTIISAEEDFFNYRVNGLLWRDIMDHSVGNYEWLIDNGVEFAETVDYYPDAGKYPTCHYFKGGTGSSGQYYISPMHARAAALGVDIRYGVRARALGCDESGKVNAVYTEDVSDGTVSKITCKAAILAGGGYGCNQDMMAARGLKSDNCLFWSLPGNNGDTLKMSTAVGGKDESLFHGYMDMQVTPATNGISLASCWGLWVNEDGDRFINEDCTTKTYDVVCPAMRTQKAVYLVCTEKSATTMFNNVQSQWISNFAEDIKAAAGKDGLFVYEGATVADAAKAAGLNPDVLTATVNRYNELCAAGADTDFGKEASKLVPVDEGPWYICKLFQQIYITVGGIATNRQFEVIDNQGNAIEGLYAVGVDGIETYLELYNTTVSGGANANNINSGRYSAINAIEKYVK